MKKKILLLAQIEIVIYCIIITILLFSDIKFEYSFILIFLLTIIFSLPFIFIILNRLVLQTRWYKLKSCGSEKFSRKIPFNLKVINVGSWSSYYAFDYSKTGISGANWAIGPQTLWYDFQVIKNYHSYLSNGAHIILPLCPLSFYIVNYSDPQNDEKYHSFLHPILISNYSPKIKSKMVLFHKLPLLVYPKGIIRLIKDCSKKPWLKYNELNHEEMKMDANKWMKSWTKQFSIENLEYPFSDELIKNREENISILKELIQFCQERDLNPVFVLPPISKELLELFPKSFCEQHINENIYRVIGNKKITYLNYWGNKELSNPQFYFNSFCLNQLGREFFTKKVLSDIGLIITNKD